MAAPISARRNTDGRAKDDNQSLCWKERKGPAQVAVLTREPREQSSLSPVAFGKQECYWGRRREGKAERPKLRGNSTQPLRLQPLDPHP